MLMDGQAVTSNWIPEYITTQNGLQVVKVLNTYFLSNMHTHVTVQHTA